MSRSNENARDFQNFTYRPMLFHPQPLAPTNEISAKAQDIVNPDLSRSGSMVGIVLNVQSNQGLGHTVY